jgi:hypothetical protein
MNMNMQHGQDVEHLEHTTIAETSKLMMQILSFIKKRTKENKLDAGINDKPSELRVEVNGMEVYRGNGTNESQIKPLTPLQREQVKALVNAMNFKEGEKVDVPFRDAFVTLNGQEIFRIKDGVVVKNLLVDQTSEVSVTIDSQQSERSSTSSNRPVKKTPVEKSLIGVPQTPPVLSRDEQLDTMAKGLNGLLVLDRLERLFPEQIGQKSQEVGRSLGNFNVFSDQDNKLTIYKDSALVFEKIDGQVTHNKLTDEDFVSLDKELKKVESALEVEELPDYEDLPVPDYEAER